MLAARSEYVTTRDGHAFRAVRRANQVIITPARTGSERPVSMDHFIDGYLLLRENPDAGTPEIGGVNASYILALSRLLLEQDTK